MFLLLLQHFGTSISLVLKLLAVLCCALVRIFRFMEEWKSQGEVNALRASLKTRASVKRDGVFAIIESSNVIYYMSPCL
jgi:magnesium-transporting ATPase (P-type)